MVPEVNEQITDAVTQTNIQVVANANAVAMANVYQTAAHSTGLMFANAVLAQGQQNILSQAVTTQGVIQIYSLNTNANAIANSSLTTLVDLLQTQ